MVLRTKMSRKWLTILCLSQGMSVHHNGNNKMIQYARSEMIQYVKCNIIEWPMPLRARPQTINM